jgi:hypothetical protein
MPPAFRAVFSTAFFAFILTACVAQPGKKLVTYNEQTTELPKPIKVHDAGSYGLYPDDGITPIDAPVTLQPGQTIGFRHASDGTVVGFAAGKEYKLTAVLANDYSWKFLGKTASK